jgi:2-polyprenyl-3-methyl-5-hydroxy-6-metoxy-1,4-benzoquinol methylase
MGPRLDRLRSRMFEFYWTMESIVTPGLNNSQHAYKDTLAATIRPEQRLLDLGCGHQLLPEWMPQAMQDAAAIITPAKQVVGLDRDYASLARHTMFRDKVCAELHQLPFADTVFDVVTANMVMEHVEHPPIMLAEIWRVLKPGGIFLFHTPNKNGYSSLVTHLMPKQVIPWLSGFLLGREAEDVYPTFYRLNTREAISNAAHESGLQLADFTYLESSAQARMLGPFVVLELLLIKVLRHRAFSAWRTNIIAILQNSTVTLL